MAAVRSVNGAVAAGPALGVVVVDAIKTGGPPLAMEPGGAKLEEGLGVPEDMIVSNEQKVTR